MVNWDLISCLYDAKAHAFNPRGHIAFFLNERKNYMGQDWITGAEVPDISSQKHWSAFVRIPTKASCPSCIVADLPQTTQVLLGTLFFYRSAGYVHTQMLLYYWLYHAHVHAKLFQSCPTLHDPMDCNLLGSPVHGIFQARIVAWVTMPSSRGSFWPRDQTWISYVSCTDWWILYQWATGKRARRILIFYPVT